MDTTTPDVSRTFVAYIASLELMKSSSRLPANKNRSALVHTLARTLGLFSPTTDSSRALILVPPQKAQSAQLGMYHTKEYLGFILNEANANSSDDVTKAEFGLEDDCPPFDGMSEYVRLVAGATLTAVKTLRQPRCDVAICWDGGRHHAQKERAAGFCYIADCTLALMELRRWIVTDEGKSRKSRAMYLDLDLHFSDAVSHAFHESASNLLTLSVHHAAPGFFPPSPLAELPTENSDPYTISLSLRPGACSKTFSRIWQSIENVREAFDPDVVVLQCGVDGLAGDPCGTFNWSLGPEEGSLGWCVDRVVNGWRGKKLLLGGGGYDGPNAARAWAYLTSLVVGKPLSLEAPIPDHSFFPLYAPSFTLDVPAGFMQDQNSDEYLAQVVDTLDIAVRKLGDSKV